MSEGGTLTTPRSALADENSGASQACILGPRDRWQAPTRSYTEAELWLPYHGTAKALSTDFDRGGPPALAAGAGVVSDKSKLVPRYQLRGGSHFCARR